MAEKKHWIAGAIKHPGALKRAAARAGKGTMEFAREHQGEGGTTGKRARLALTLSRLRHR